MVTPACISARLLRGVYQEPFTISRIPDFTRRLQMVSVNVGLVLFGT
jgi:hypothetical protein